MRLMRGVCLLICLPLAMWADEAGRLYKEARKAESRGQAVEAFTLYAKAAGLRPDQPRYRMGLERLQVRVGQALAAVLPPPPQPGTTIVVAGDDPASELPSRADLLRAEQPAEPPRLRYSGSLQDLDIQGDARALYERVGEAFRVRVVFDPDFSPGPTVRFRLTEASFREAIRAVMALTSTFVVPLDDSTLLVAAENQQKRNELEPFMAALLPIPQVMSVEEANEVGRAVQQALDIKRLIVDAGRRQVYLRDTVTRVRLARALYQELSRRRGEVLLDFELVSSGRSNVINFGATLPTSFPVFNLSPFGGNRPPAETGTVLSLGGGDTLFGIRIGDAAFQADWARSQGDLLTRFQLRATDGLPASLHIGDRFPIVNAIFSPIVLTDEIRDLEEQGQLRTPFPSFTFEDLGLVLKVTPRVHDLREVTLTLEAEFRVLTGASLNGLPVISTRKFSSAVRLRLGETSLVSGLAAVQRIMTRSGFGPLARIPLLGRLFSRSAWQTEQTELILSITPHLTIAPPGEQFPSRVLYSGAEGRSLPPI